MRAPLPMMAALTFVKGVDGPPSPPARPFIQEMPILPVLPPSDPNNLIRGRIPEGYHDDQLQREDDPLSAPTIQSISAERIL